jgi:DNA-directed RNA polymerase specialized sigma24 family protein
MSYADIAAATNVSIGTVMSRLFNGKRKLKKIMQDMP